MRKTAGKRRVSLILILTLLLVSAGTTHADGNNRWNCLECGAQENTGNFCPNCGSKNPSIDWTCGFCGQTGNTGNFCPTCGNARQSAEARQGIPDSIKTDPGKQIVENVLPGYHFYFGKMEQDTFQVDGEEPIVWRVLEVDPNRRAVLAMSEFGLYTMKYHRNDKETRWRDTDVRDWLNTTFLSCFTSNERKSILRTTVSGSEDYIFLLDSQQIMNDLESPYICYATPWALMHGEDGAYVNEDTGGSSWLVRTDVAKKRIAWVGGAGKLYSPEGKKGMNYLTSKDNVVRPVMWISMDAIGNEAEDYGFPLYARAIMDIATRSGPTTGYTGLGSYKVEGHVVRVISRVNDGSIWWLQIEFEYNNTIVRCYTGLKRVDIDISKVPDEPGYSIGKGIVRSNENVYYGPGKLYKEMPDQLKPDTSTTGTIISEENGWVCFEFDYEQNNETARVWLPVNAVIAE